MKNYKKAILASLAMVGTSCAIISGATFALFSNESTTNIAITSGKIDVQATGTVSSYYKVSGGAKTEGEWSNGDVTVDGSLVSVNNIYHGEGVILDIKVENKSSINVKYQVSLTGVAAYAVSSNGVYKNVKVSTVESAVDFVPVGNGTYLTNWTSVVEPDTTTHISVDIRLPEYADNYDGSYCEYTIGVNAVQGNKHVEDPESVEPKVTEGLQFTSINGGAAYSVTGIGEATDTDIVVPEVFKELPVTGIGSSAFKDCKDITSITLPDTITSIGGSAFQGCTSLESINIPDGVTSIGRYTFENTPNLESITLPDSVTSIGGYAFQYSGIKSIAIPDSVTSIDGYAFQYSAIESVTFGENCKMEAITSYAFQLCKNLKSITIPASVTSIGFSAFNQCTSLESVEILGEVTSIGYRAFFGCKSLKSIVIPASVTFIGYGAFWTSGLTSAYYCGNVDDVTLERNGNEMAIPSNAKFYYYSDEYPYDGTNEEYFFWHYENGEIVVWEKN